MTTIIRQLIHYINQSDADIFEASLVLARYADPQLNIEKYLHLLHAWSIELKEQITPDDDVTHQVAKLNTFLFKQKGFHSNHEDFYNPANGFMNQVIERQTGIPVTMSVLYATLGQKVGINLEGISFPGHFLVKVAVDNGIFILDPYHCGVSLSEEQLAKLLKHADPNASPETLLTYLETASIEETVTRMMRSLKTVYYKRGSTEQTLELLNMMLELDPSLIEERRERGLLLHQMQCSYTALDDLGQYIKLRPNCAETTKIRSIIKDLKEEVATLH